MKIVDLLKVLFSDDTEEHFGYMAIRKEYVCIDGTYNLKKMQTALDKLIDRDKYAKKGISHR